jgi:hypothetical protein
MKTIMEKNPGMEPHEHRNAIPKLCSAEKFGVERVCNGLQGYPHLCNVNIKIILKL